MAGLGRLGAAIMLKCHIRSGLTALGLMKNGLINSQSKRGFRVLVSPLLQKSESQTLTKLTKTDEGIHILTLNNPKKRNALSLTMLDELKQNFEDIVDTATARVIIIKSDAPVFSAGHDLKELTSKDGREHHMKVFQRCTEVMNMVQDMPLPVIAEVGGLATAAGCQLVASCDIAVASENARFATPGVSLGLFCSTPAVALARAVPRKIAMEMLFTGHPISAQDALTHGLVSKVVPEDKLEEETMKIAKRICETSKPVAALGKACFYKQIATDRNSAYELAGNVMAENLRLYDAQEGIDAFAKKRSPVWQHTDENVH